MANARRMMTAILCLALGLPMLHAVDAQSRSSLVYVGAIGTNAQGIYAYRFHTDTGEAEFLGLKAAMLRPSFLVASRDQRFLYAVSETSEPDGGSVNAYRIGGQGALALINSVSSGGANPCDLAIDPGGTALLVSNCSGGSVALLPVRADGGLDGPAAMVQHHGRGLDPRQKGPYAHGVAITPDRRFAAVADFGLDRIFLHPLNAPRHTLAEGTASVSVVPGGAVRHIAFSPNGRFLYAIDEYDSVLSVFRYSKGNLYRVETISALSPGATAKRGGAELAFDARGRYLYVSIRGEENKVAVFAVNSRSGRASPIQFVSARGAMPRHIALSADGGWLAVANQNSHSIIWIQRDQQSGRLTDKAVRREDVDSPACVVFAEDR